MLILTYKFIINYKLRVINDANNLEPKYKIRKIGIKTQDTNKEMI